MKANERVRESQLHSLLSDMKRVSDCFTRVTTFTIVWSLSLSLSLPPFSILTLVFQLFFLSLRNEWMGELESVSCIHHLSGERKKTRQTVSSDARLPNPMRSDTFNFSHLSHSCVLVSLGEICGHLRLGLNVSPTQMEWGVRSLDLSLLTTKSPAAATHAFQLNFHSPSFPFKYLSQQKWCGKAITYLYFNLTFFLLHLIVSLLYSCCHPHTHTYSYRICEWFYSPLKSWHVIYHSYFFVSSH